MYLNKAHSFGCDGEVLYTLRCQAHLKLGHFAFADEDAGRLLDLNPFSTKGLVVTAEAKYHNGNFERALMYFNR